jgi:WD40 repeat protein
MNIPGDLLITGGDDKRIIIWDLIRSRTAKVLDSLHKGTVFQVEFSADSDYIYSSSDDGRVLIWKWKTSTIVNDVMQHSFPIRCFDYNFRNPDLVVCGRNDGGISVWNTEENITIDEILPEPKLFINNVDEKEKHHTSAITCLKLSLDQKLLATASLDDTCKIWKITSYNRDYDQVKKNLKVLFLLKRKWSLLERNYKGLSIYWMKILIICFKKTRLVD